MLLETRMPRGGSYAEDPSFATPATLSEVFNADYDANRYSWLTNSAQRASEKAYDDRIAAIKSETGVELDNPWRAEGTPLPIIVPQRGVFGLPSISIASAGSVRDNAWRAFDARMQELAEQRPDLRDLFLRPLGDDAVRLQRDTAHRAEDAFSRGPTGSWGARLAAGLVSSFEDPVNVMSLAAGPWGTVGQGAKAVIWSGVKVGTINAAAEIASYPAIKEWRQRAGLEYTPQQLAEHAGIAFAFGFGLDAGGRGGFRASRNLFQGGEVVPAPSAPAGGQTPQPLRPPPKDPATALEQAAKALPESNTVRRAAEGDRKALDELVAAAGLEDDPSIRGAKMADDADATLRAEFDEADRSLKLASRLREDDEANLAQATRHALDDAEPPPGRADPVPEARTPDLSDEAPLPKGTRNQHGMSFKIDGRKVRFREVDPAKITAEPETFQFKAGGDASGANGRLTGVTQWDPIAAGRAMVFEKKSGELVIADGHQRLSLAKRLAAGGDEDVSMPSFIMREADGWTPADVRAMAAKKNLQEGSGTTVDAAKIMRERPDIIDASMPLSTDAMRQARSLSRLSDEAFDQVVAGIIPPNHAAIVGDLVPDKSRHASLINDMVSAEPANAREARLMLGELMSAPVHAEVQLTLLGAEHVHRSLLRERVKVLDGAMKMLRDDARIFGLLTREAGRIESAGNQLAGDVNVARAMEAETVSAMLERLATSRGPVSDWLSDAARDVAQGGKVKEAAEGLARQVREALDRDGIGGLTDYESTPLRAGGIEEPNGPQAKAQVETLEAQYKDEQASLFKDDMDDANRTGAIGILVKGCNL